MNPERWQRIKDLFNAALERDSPGREEYLDTACDGDPTLRRQIEDLLAAYRTDFLEEDSIDPKKGVNTRLAPGQMIDHYTVTRLLGVGGMGEVYLARDVVLQRDVAIKLLTANGLSSEDESRHRLLREARAAAALDHPNICSVYEVVEKDQLAFIAMQYIDGQTLASRLKAGPLGVDETLHIAVQIADALAAAHARGLIHRDIKPENIMLTGAGQAKVMDFGLAKILEAASTGEDETRKQLTQVGMILGTPVYMSPEQAKGGQLDERSDIFSLGAVLYEMLTGHRAFDAASTAEILVAILTREPQLMSNSLRIPPLLQQVVSKMLEKNRDHRFGSMAEVAAELNRCREHSNEIDSAATPLLVSRDRDHPSRHRLARMTVAAIVAALLAGLIYTFFFNRRGTDSVPQVRSLAVLPLENLSGDSAQEYFADGMTDALISNLSQIRELRVISRTSVMRYKGERPSLPEIADSLGVDAIIEGSVIRSGDRVRITAQLIHGESDTHLWARNYEREVSDILKLQSDVAQAIASEIRVRLTPAEQKRLSSAKIVDPKAHEAYLLGKFHVSRTNEADIEIGIRHLEQAVQIEPNYADAYAALAAAWLDRGIWGAPSLAEVESKVRSAADAAIRIDPGNAKARIAMCQLLTNYDYNWTAAEDEAKRALEIDPNDPEVLVAYSWLLQSLGRHDEVRPKMEKAVQLDPISARAQASFGRMLYRARDYDLAERYLKRSIELEPTVYGSYGRLADVYVETGRFEEALVQLDKASIIQPDGAHALRKAVVYARMGDRAKALEAVAGVSNRPAWEMARLHTALGEPTKAFEILNAAVDRRDTLLVHLKEDPGFMPLHSDPRWKRILKRLNFPDA